MGFYEKHCLPHVLNCACGLRPFHLQRQKVVPQARGRVLEVGMGSGLNLPFYDAANVEMIWGLEPSPAMRNKAQANLAKSTIDVRWLNLPGEEIPLDDNSVDTILLTYTLCTIPDWQKALEQMRRVLKPGGELIFCEHGIAPDASVQKWQARVNRSWGKIFGGCHLNRPIPEYLDKGGFNIDKMETMYLPGLKIATYTYWGVATQK